jgi:hypothetical protein
LAGRVVEKDERVMWVGSKNERLRSLFLLSLSPSLSSPSHSPSHSSLSTLVTSDNESFPPMYPLSPSQALLCALG